MTTVVIVGSGIGGLVAALAANANPANTVTLVTKSRLEESNTRYAQGGIAAAVFADDSVAEHISDTLGAGAGINVLEAAEVLCTEGPDRIADLIGFGVEFDRATDGSGLARGLEAAHSHARVLHSGGDATGAAIERALVATVRRAGIRILENSFLVDLAVEGNRAVGVELLADGATEPHRVEADAVIIASGGAGQLFLHTTNPAVATGDGAAAAWRAGAAMADVEFYQFHPTALAVPGNFLVSEAVRGEGAVLLGATGQRFMAAVHPDAELAPRDIVARGIANEMAAHDGAPVLLDATALGADFLRKRFPTINAACRSAGFDWANEPVPVTPAAHYWMGGIATDTHGRTSIPGLYAVGEVACTGAHGANRLASNSLLEAAVLAHRAAEVIGERSWPESSLWKISETTSGQGDVAGPDIHPEPAGPLAAPCPVPFTRAALQRLMWEHAGVHRSGEGLAAATGQLAHWIAARAEATGSIPVSTPPSVPLSVAEREDSNLLDLAQLIVGSALQRRESRGAHFRSDFPEQSSEFARHIVRAREVFALC